MGIGLLVRQCAGKCLDHSVAGTAKCLHVTTSRT